MTTRAPARLATGTTPAIGKTESVEPTARSRSQASAASCARDEVAPDEALAERDGGGLENAAAAPARRVGLAGAHAGERTLHRSPLVARQAHHLAHGAVDLDDAGRVGAGLLVKAVDVLGDQRVELPAPLEGDERAVPGVGLGRPRRRVEPALPRELTDLGVGHVVLERRHLLGLGVLGPDALRAAKIRDARLGGDAGAGERHDLAGGVDPAAGRRDQRVVGQRAAGAGASARQAAKSSSAARVKAHMLASRSARPVSRVSARSTGPETAKQEWPAASP